MAKLKQIYKCSVCGNIVEVLHEGMGTLVCCNRPMELIIENTLEASLEKHIPVIEKTDNGVLIKIGSIEHPMEEKHYIEWIEVSTQNYIYRKYLYPGDKPEALFKIDEAILNARAYCNIHGLWKA